MYHRKYCKYVRAHSGLVISGRTWLVHTLLKATKANVWANMVEGRSFLAKAIGIRTTLRSSCGRNARRSSSNDGGLAFGEEFRYSRVL